MFDFPATPTENQVFTPPGGPTYVYRAPVWTQASAGSITPPTAQTRNRICNGAMQISQEWPSPFMVQTSRHSSDPVDQFYVTWIIVPARCQLYRLRRVTPNGTQEPHSIDSRDCDRRCWRRATLLKSLNPIEGSRVADFGWGQPGKTGDPALWFQGTGRHLFGVRAEQCGAIDPISPTSPSRQGRPTPIRSRSSSSPATRPGRG